MVAYQNLITKSMYDKQLDSGRGTLLHLCDDVIQQEVCKPHYIPNRFNWLCASDVSLNAFLQVKEVIISYYILMEQGKATVQVSISPSSLFCSQTTLCNRTIEVMLASCCVCSFFTCYKFTGS